MTDSDEPIVIASTAIVIASTAIVIASTAIVIASTAIASTIIKVNSPIGKSLFNAEAVFRCTVEAIYCRLAGDGPGRILSHGRCCQLH